MYEKNGNLPRTLISRQPNIAPFACIADVHRGHTGGGAFQAMESGANLPTWPDQVRVLRLRQVIDRTGMSRSTIYSRGLPSSRYYDPKWPARVRFGGITGWIEAEIIAYIELCVARDRGGDNDE